MGVGSIRDQTMWKLSFLSAIRSIWKERNMRCFEGKAANVKMVVEAIKRLAALWVSPLPHFKGISVNSIIEKEGDGKLPSPFGASLSKVASSSTRLFKTKF